MMFDTGYETMKATELRQVQLERLQSTLNRAYLNVAHYRRALDALGMLPDEIKSLDDIRKLPFTTRADIEKGYPYDMFAVPLREVGLIGADGVVRQLRAGNRCVRRDVRIPDRAGGEAV